jgi:hypothetical protein
LLGSPGQVAELELLLHSADGVALAALLDGRYRQDGTGRAGSAGRRQGWSPAGLDSGVGPSVGVEAAPPYWTWQQVLGSLARTTDVALRLLALVPAFRRGFAEQLSAIGPR